MPHFDPQPALAEHDRWLRTVVLARVGERAAVDEVMQEVALAALRQQAPLVDASKAGSLALSRGAHAVAAVSPQAGTTAETGHALCRASSPDAARHPHSSTRSNGCWPTSGRSLVRQAIARLPRREVEILLLKYTENWSYEQLAQRLGVSESAVESRLHRARARLRQELAALEEAKGRTMNILEEFHRIPSACSTGWSTASWASRSGASCWRRSTTSPAAGEAVPWHFSKRRAFAGNSRDWLPSSRWRRLRCDGREFVRLDFREASPWMVEPLPLRGCQPAIGIWSGHTFSHGERTGLAVALASNG